MAGYAKSVEGAAGDVDDSASELGGVFEGPSATVPAAARSVGASGGTASAGVGAAGRVRDAPRSARVIGRGAVAPDPRLFPWDISRGRTLTRVEWGATPEDRMAPAAAGAMMEKIKATLNIEKETEDILYAFHMALLFQHATNGASTLQSGRAELQVAGATFSMAEINGVLGNEQRRFYRAYADETASVLRAVLRDYDPNDPESAERVGLINQIAVKRGLQKFPHLIHDSAEAGRTLSIEERVALQASKASYLPKVSHEADRLLSSTYAADAE